MVDGTLRPRFDNFYSCTFVVDGKKHYSSENFFQCMKAVTPEDQEQVRRSGAGCACWAAGNKLKAIRHNWDAVKVDYMYQANKQKFTQNDHLLQELIQTEGSIRFSGSTPFWCLWNGLILERIRAEQRHTSHDQQIASRISHFMETYRRSGTLTTELRREILLWRKHIHPRS